MKNDVAAVSKANEYREQLAAIAAPAIPGTPENRRYHDTLDAIQRAALEIRKQREGR